MSKALTKSSLTKTQVWQALLAALFGTLLSAIAPSNTSWPLLALGVFVSGMLIAMILRYPFHPRRFALAVGVALVSGVVLKLVL